MFKLIVATLAAMYLIAMSVGDAPETQEVARADDPAFDLSLASFVGAAEASAGDVTEAMVAAPIEGDLDLSSAEAIKAALVAGQTLRAERAPATPLLGTAVAQDIVADAADVKPADLWRVTGSTVNLRSGPGTANGVVAQLTLGTEAEVLDEGNGWFRIRTADGAVDGWIFGKYLSQDG